jgi:hypothetical protein
MKAMGKDNYRQLVQEWDTQTPKSPEKPKARINGNEVIRRYADGTVDHSGTAEKAVRFMKAQKLGMCPLYPSDAALLVLVFPKEYGHLMDSPVAKSYCRQVRDEDLKKIQDIVRNSFVDGDEIKG